MGNNKSNKSIRCKTVTIGIFIVLIIRLSLIVSIRSILIFPSVQAQDTCVQPNGIPQSQIVSSDISGKVKIIWSDNSTNEDGFRIKRYDEDQFKWITVKELPSTSVSPKFTLYETYDETLVCDGNPTNYIVAAYNACGEAGGGGSNGACLPSEIIQTPMPTTIPCMLKYLGDADCDGKVNIADFERWRKEYVGELFTKTANFDYILGAKIVDIVDFEIWRKGNFDFTIAH